jgi:hypothetical protein
VRRDTSIAHRLRVLGDFLLLEIETGSSFGRQVLPQTVSDVTNVDVFRLACTVKKLYDIFGYFRNLAVTFL